ncbi:MAG TPA: hypothetical protein VGG33_23520, partial [Polyangia bacterium]
MHSGQLPEPVELFVAAHDQGGPCLLAKTQRLGQPRGQRDDAPVRGGDFGACNVVGCDQVEGRSRKRRDETPPRLGCGGRQNRTRRLFARKVSRQQGPAERGEPLGAAFGKRGEQEPGHRGRISEEKS